MLDNEKAIKLTSYDERKAEIISRLNDYEDKDIFNIFFDANCYDGSFDFVACYDLEDICDMVSDNYELARSIIYGNVENVNDRVRYNAYGNLESVNEYELYHECGYYIDDLAEWLMSNYDNTSSLYSDDEELFEIWWKIDHDQWEEDEDE